jgi:hypothetical protein
VQLAYRYRAETKRRRAPPARTASSAGASVSDTDNTNDDDDDDANAGDGGDDDDEEDDGEDNAGSDDENREQVCECGFCDGDAIVRTQQDDEDIISNASRRLWLVDDAQKPVVIATPCVHMRCDMMCRVRDCDVMCRVRRCVTRLIDRLVELANNAAYSKQVGCC